ncbi:MAG: hypothetical protein LBH85_01840 [Treponema sp.]|nr:hypothetical protein [Treponema sp.]
MTIVRPSPQIPLCFLEHDYAIKPLKYSAARFFNFTHHRLFIVMHLNVVRLYLFFPIIIKDDV